MSTELANEDVEPTNAKQTTDEQITTAVRTIVAHGRPCRNVADEHGIPLCTYNYIIDYNVLTFN